jgi:hypothetical protein
MVLENILNNLFLELIYISILLVVTLTKDLNTIFIFVFYEYFCKTQTKISWFR